MEQVKEQPINDVINKINESKLENISQLKNVSNLALEWQELNELINNINKNDKEKRKEKGKANWSLFWRFLVGSIFFALMVLSISSIFLSPCKKTRIQEKNIVESSGFSHTITIKTNATFFCSFTNDSIKCALGAFLGCLSVCFFTWYVDSRRNLIKKYYKYE